MVMSAGDVTGLVGDEWANGQRKLTHDHASSTCLFKARPLGVIQFEVSREEGQGDTKGFKLFLFFFFGIV